MRYSATTKELDKIVEFTAFENFISFERKGKKIYTTYFFIILKIFKD